MTFSPITSAAVSDQGTGPNQPEPQPGTGHASYGEAAAQEEAGEQGDQDVPWPHQSYLELGSLPTAAPCARLHTKLMLWEWDLGALAQTAALIVSELVSNAVQASTGITDSRFAGKWAPGTPPVRVWLSADDYRLVIQVWDGSDQPPVPQPVEPEADSGRGLLLVGSLSAEWGCYAPEESSGKVVWAVVEG
jgi:anti-sigma regulatory factor (Ser/Thr protein kinase)